MATKVTKIFDEQTLYSFSDVSEFVDEIKALLKGAHTFEKPVRQNMALTNYICWCRTMISQRL